MSIKASLQEKMKAAMKSGDKDTLTFCRNLHASIRKKEIDDRMELDDTAVQKIIMSLLKQRQDSIEQFRRGGREDLATKEEAEAAFLKSFLPEQLGPDQLRPIIEAAIQQSGAKGPKDLGAVMKLVLPQVQGKADGKLVNQMIREKLGG